MSYQMLRPVIVKESVLGYFPLYYSYYTLLYFINTINDVCY